MIGFWVFMFIMLLITPVTMIILGCYFSKNVPDKINYTFGYRTKRSMRNNDTWNFANLYFGMVWRRMGIILLPATIISMMFCFGRDAGCVGSLGLIIIIIQIVLLIMTVCLVENELKKTFDENGKRRKHVNL